MKNKPAAIYFDKNDYQLLRIVKDVLERGRESRNLRSLLVEHMHPHGIKEMAAPQGLRIAYATASLLGSFEQGTANDRIKALRSLRDEVFLSSSSFYQKNTARILVQIMKDLLRCRDDEISQLKLAHDFRMVFTGNPRRVREELAKYHLLEMPEDWDQYAFDDHVHDANTKGRKSPTHLVMDAWIKGIRYLTVVYYNYVSPEVIEELIEASAALNVRIQIGIEMLANFGNKYARFTWEPHGFNNNRAFLKFLKDEEVMKLMERGRKVSLYQQRYVFEVFKVFNNQYRKRLNKELGISLEPLLKSEFLNFVGAGQPSLLHLASFIRNGLLVHIDEEEWSSEECEQKRGQRHNRIAVENIIEEFLLPSCNPEIHDPTQPGDDADIPQLLKFSPKKLLSTLLSLHSSSKFTLNLNSLSAQETLELLYTCKGMITHIEIYNLKNGTHGMTSCMPFGLEDIVGDITFKSPEHHYSLVSALQKALNEDNVISLKRVIRTIVWEYEAQRLQVEEHVKLLVEESPVGERVARKLLQMDTRKKQLMDILYHLEIFHHYYKKRTLGSRIGSGSTGQAEHQYGMGMVVLNTLPPRARKTVKKEIAGSKRSVIPATALLTRNSHLRCHDSPGIFGVNSVLKVLPCLKNSTCNRWHDWSLDGFFVHPGTPGNIATLGGSVQKCESGKACVAETQEKKFENPWKYLNTNLKNTLKVVLGFIPAFLTFSLTKDWWLLAYFGAFIWFGITGSRNIIQSVLGGGGLRRSPLLPWNSLVSWSRISDSLLYTGFSVPLLDYFVKTMLLDQTLGITTATNPVLLYSVMGLANGIYISGHNIFRGLPRTAATGNFFRSILAIPLAIVLNSLIGMILQFTGVPDVTGVLQKWAAIISKLASDCVAAVIEGLVDRQTNIRARLTAYRTKISQLFAVFSRLDLQFPQEDVLEMLRSPKMMMETLNYETREQEKLIIVNALDLMYFWMYQARARKALTIIFQEMSKEEWLVFYRSQLVLNRHREISQFFVDGLVGKHFSRALSFYLDRSEEYLRDMEKLGLTKKLID